MVGVNVTTSGYRAWMFALLWTTYGSSYLVRKPLGVIKADLAADLVLDRAQLGLLDAALLLPYSLTQMVLGPLADHLGPRKTLVACLTLAASAVAMFGSSDSFQVLLFQLFLCGAALGPMWPSCSKALACWFPNRGGSRDTVFGLFSTSGLVGGVCGTALAVAFQDAYGWRHIHLVPSLVLLVLAVGVATWLRTPDEACGDRSALGPLASPVDSGCVHWREWQSLWSLPLIPEVTLAVFMLKTVRYCMYMWLPLYLLDHLHYNRTQAGLMSTVFEIGGGLGSAAMGVVVDRAFGGRWLRPVLASAVASGAALWLFVTTAAGGSAYVHGAFLLLAGAANCGADTLLSGSIPARLGESGGRGAGAALTGLVNGAGSLGTVLEGPVIGLVAEHFGWIGVFLLMVMLSSLAALSLLRAAVLQRNRDGLSSPNTTPNFP